MKRISLLLCGLALLLITGCATVTREQSAITRTFRSSEIATLNVIDEAAVAGGFQKISDHEYQRVIAKRKDPILGLITVSEQMDFGIGFTLELESKPNATLVTVLPVTIVRMPFSETHYERTPLRPGTKYYADIIRLMENAKARAEFQ